MRKVKYAKLRSVPFAPSVPGLKDSFTFPPTNNEKTKALEFDGQGLLITTPGPGGKDTTLYVPVHNIVSMVLDVEENS